MPNVVFDPEGGGQIILGNPRIDTGGFTALITSISAQKGGFGAIQCIQSSGTAYGELRLNPTGGQVTLPTLVAITSLPVAPAGTSTVDVVIDKATGRLYRQS